jgi:hypothetical protein
MPSAKIGKSRGGESEREICGEAHTVPFHRLVELLCADAVDSRQIGIEQNALIADREDQSFEFPGRGMDHHARSTLRQASG